MSSVRNLRPGSQGDPGVLVFGFGHFGVVYVRGFWRLFVLSLGNRRRVLWDAGFGGLGRLGLQGFLGFFSE